MWAAHELLLQVLQAPLPARTSHKTGLLLQADSNSVHELVHRSAPELKRKKEEGGKDEQKEASQPSEGFNEYKKKSTFRVRP